MNRRRFMCDRDGVPVAADVGSLMRRVTPQGHGYTLPIVFLGAINATTRSAPARSGGDRWGERVVLDAVVLEFVDSVQSNANSSGDGDSDHNVCDRIDRADYRRH